MEFKSKYQKQIVSSSTIRENDEDRKKIQTNPETNIFGRVDQRYKVFHSDEGELDGWTVLPIPRSIFNNIPFFFLFKIRNKKG